jgi:hypothetical protein
VYVCTDGAPEPLTGFTDPEHTARGVLAAVLARPGDNVAAHETRDHEHGTATSIRTLLDEYETLAHHALKPRWADLLTAAGLTPEQLSDVQGSPAYGALSTALRRADAHGLPVAAALPRLLDGAAHKTQDLAAVVHARVERFTDAALDAGRGGPARLVGGLVPAVVDVADVELADALHARELLVDARTYLVLKRARLARAPWLAALGPQPTDQRSHRRWTTAARTVAAYRDRYDITDPTTPLGPGAGADRQRAAARDLAATAIATLATGAELLRPALLRPSGHSPPAVERECQIPMGR